jgi:hypothetical protein
LRRTHRITAGEDTGQALLLVDDQHRAGTALPHAATGLLYRLVLSQQQRVLVFDNIGKLSVGHFSALL